MDPVGYHSVYQQWARSANGTVERQLFVGNSCTLLDLSSRILMVFQRSLAQSLFAERRFVSTDVMSKLYVTMGSYFMSQESLISWTLSVSSWARRLAVCESSDSANSFMVRPLGCQWHEGNLIYIRSNADCQIAGIMHYNLYVLSP